MSRTIEATAELLVQLNWIWNWRLREVAKGKTQKWNRFDTYSMTFENQLRRRLIDVRLTTGGTLSHHSYSVRDWENNLKERMCTR
jgi:hypothetical protein